jgi:hypothetical protein
MAENKEPTILDKVKNLALGKCLAFNVNVKATKTQRQQ